MLRAQLDEDRLNLDAALANFNGSIEIAMKNSDLFMKHVDILASTTANGAGTAGSLASSALNSNNTMVSSVQ